MALIGGYNLLHMISSYRVVSLMGGYGSYKTALSFKLAEQLFQQKRVKRIVSNCRSLWNEDLGRLVIDDAHRADTAVIVDEGGVALHSRRDAETMLAFLRKMNIFIFVPSVVPPPRILQPLVISRTFTFMPIGIPLLIFNAKLHIATVRESYSFMWWRPDTLGVYDTFDAPVDAYDILDWLDLLKDRISSGSKKYSEVSGRRGGLKSIPIDEGIRQMESVADTIEEVGELVLDASAVYAKKRKKVPFFGG